jgi:hypothetical protein
MLPVLAREELEYFRVTKEDMVEVRCHLDRAKADDLAGCNLVHLHFAEINQLTCFGRCPVVYHGDHRRVICGRRGISHGNTVKSAPAASKVR